MKHFTLLGQTVLRIRPIVIIGFIKFVGLLIAVSHFQSRCERVMFHVYQSDKLPSVFSNRNVTRISVTRILRNQSVLPLHSQDQIRQLVGDGLHSHRSEWKTVRKNASGPVTFHPRPQHPKSPELVRLRSNVRGVEKWPMVFWMISTNKLFSRFNVATQRAWLHLKLSHVFRFVWLCSPIAIWSNC